MSRLEDFLDKKPLFYSEIDTTLMQRAYDSISSYFDYSGTTVHLVGTNGKGSTGRYLATYLYKDNKKVGHYTSPHIDIFNERVWLNGELATDELLDIAHDKLQNILSQDFIDKLSYFEYTTFIAMLLFIDNNVEYIILEAGLGGEYDATSVFKRDLSLLTTVGLDHTDFLGNSIEEITTTKVNSVSSELIIGHQNDDIVKTISKDICNTKNIKVTSIDDYITSDDLENIFLIKMAKYLKNNLKLTISALKFLGFRTINYKYFDGISFFGRCQKISDNITIDVGHNLLAANELAKEFENQKVTLIYNTFKDKDYINILKVLKPVIKELLIIDIDNDRVESRENLIKYIKQLGLNFDTFKRVSQNEQYLVFGSFVVVEEFLKRYKVNER